VSTDHEEVSIFLANQCLQFLPDNALANQECMVLTGQQSAAKQLLLQLGGISRGGIGC
jgi:hypothetical protein